MRHPLLKFLVLLALVIWSACAAHAGGAAPAPPPTVNTLNAGRVYNLSITGERRVCTPGATRIYTVRITAPCAAPVQWSLDNNIGELQPLTDTTVRIRFTRPGRAVLRATAEASCTGANAQLELDYSPMSGVLNLGSDTLICNGQPLQLQTGGNYTYTQWSDGSKGNTLTVDAPDTYHVAVSNDNVCFQRDTIVVRLRGVPDPELPRDTILCQPGTMTLQANGRFMKYQWQDGSDRSFILVDRPGTYWVTVTNSFGCTATDTTVISKVAQKPANFALFTDTALCTGTSVDLRVNSSYTAYNWNFGASRNATYRIDAPGMYTVEVRSLEGCWGLDSIEVADKSCGQNVLVPNAFTPNGDARNDVFRPTVYGLTDLYQLEIYNRWGGVVFRSRDAKTGWNGMSQQLQLPSGVYVWQIRYRFAGSGQVQSQKGTVMLVR